MEKLGNLGNWGQNGKVGGELRRLGRSLGNAEIRGSNRGAGKSECHLWPILPDVRNFSQWTNIGAFYASNPTFPYFTEPGVGGCVMRSNIVEVEKWTELGKMGQNGDVTEVGKAGTLGIIGQSCKC